MGVADTDNPLSNLRFYFPFYLLKTMIPFGFFVPFSQFFSPHTVTVWKTKTRQQKNSSRDAFLEPTNCSRRKTKQFDRFLVPTVYWREEPTSAAAGLPVATTEILESFPALVCSLSSFQTNDSHPVWPLRIVSELPSVGLAQEVFDMDVLQKLDTGLPTCSVPIFLSGHLRYCSKKVQ